MSNGTPSSNGSDSYEAIIDSRGAYPTTVTSKTAHEPQYILNTFGMLAVKIYRSIKKQDQYEEYGLPIYGHRQMPYQLVSKIAGYQERLTTDDT